MKDKLVSVIVPVYKVEQYLDKCVESIVNQTYKNLEIILVDDGSPDNCPKMCDDWAKKDERIKVVHKQNGGVSSARNAGLEVATGYYIYFCDPDDYVEKNIIASFLSSIGNSSFVICGHKEIKNDSATICDLKKISEQSNEDALKTILHTWQFGVVWNKLYIKNLIETKFDEDCCIREDLLFNANYFKKNGSFAIVAEPLYNYIKRGGSATVSNKKIPFSQILATHKIMLEALDKNNLKNAIAHENASFLKSFICLMNPYLYTRLTKKQSRELNSCLNDPCTIEALKNYKCCDFKECIFIWLLRRKKFKTLLFLMRLVKKFR